MYPKGVMVQMLHATSSLLWVALPSQTSPVMCHGLELPWTTEVAQPLGEIMAQDEICSCTYAEERGISQGTKTPTYCQVDAEMNVTSNQSKTQCFDLRISKTFVLYFNQNIVKTHTFLHF